MQSDEEGTVYFVQDSASGLIKIGFTRVDLWTRLSAARSFNPNPFTVLGIIDGCYADEFALHKEFQSERAFLEWFSPSDRLLCAIRERSKAPPPRPKARRRRAEYPLLVSKKAS